MLNIVEAYPRLGKIERTAPLWQYDAGQIIHVNGIELPAAYMAEFSNSTQDAAKQYIQQTDEITVPAQYLQSGKPVYIWLVFEDSESRTTVYEIVSPVALRAKPHGELTPDEQQAAATDLSLLGERISALEGSKTNHETIFSAMDAMLAKLTAVAQEVAYTSANHHGAELTSAITALRSAIGGGSVTPTVVSVTGVSFSANSGSLTAGQTMTLTPVFTPSNATDKGGAWASSDTTVATVAGGLVTALAAGSATITFTSTDGSFTASYALTVTANATTPTYTAQAVYTNFTATGARFSTSDIAVNFAGGDYVEAVIDASGSDVVSGTNLLSFAQNGDNSYMEYTNGEAVLVFKREQNSVMKVLFRIKDTANSVAIDKWTVPADLSNIVIKLDKDGVYLDGTAVSGVSSSDLAFLTGQSAIAIGARSSTLSKATYKSVTVYRAQ